MKLKKDIEKEVMDLSDQNLYDIVQVFKALADTTRVKIIFSLIDGECSVNEISEEVGASQSSVSQHLRRLRDIGMVSFHRHKNQVFYIIDDIHIKRILKEAVHHIEHHIEVLTQGRD